MPLDHAILAILTGGPLHGHALGKQLDRILHGLWAVNPGQVYATLGRLARDGAIAPAEDVRANAAPSCDPRPGRAPARVRAFALLPAGRSALRRWLDRPLGCDPRTDAFTLHLAALVAGGDHAGIARALDGRRRRCTALRALLDRRAPAGDDDAGLLVCAARRHLEVEVEWLAEAERALLAPAQGDATPGSADAAATRSRPGD
jgi:hypothetical protein